MLRSALTYQLSGPLKPFRVSAATYALSSTAENTASSLGRSGAPAPGPKKPPRARTPAVKAGLRASSGDPARNRALTVAPTSFSQAAEAASRFSA